MYKMGHGEPIVCCYEWWSYVVFPYDPSKDGVEENVHSTNNYTNGLLDR